MQRPSKANIGDQLHVPKLRHAHNTDTRNIYDHIKLYTNRSNVYIKLI